MRNNNTDIPVVYNFFVRPQISKKVFHEIKKFKPRILYLVSDGPRNEREKEIISLNRNQIEEMIDWECEVEKIYSNVNIGFDIMKITYQEVFKKNDMMIFLEEDILPTQSFFHFCNELLIKYKDDPSIYIITGMNFLGKYPDDGPSYFFVNSGSTWGMGLWKRTIELFQEDLSILDNKYINSIIKENMKIKNKYHHYQHLMVKKNEEDAYIKDGELYLMGFNQNILYNSLAIVPSVNLVENIGDCEGSENSDKMIMLPKKMRYISNLSASEIEFPLKHPEFKIVDYVYGGLTAKLSPNSNAVSCVYYKFERGLRILIFGGPRYFYSKLKKFIIKLIYYEIIKRKF